MDLLCLCTVAAFFKTDDFGSGENDAQWLTSCSVSSSTLLLSEFSHRAQLCFRGCFLQGEMLLHSHTNVCHDDFLTGDTDVS